MVGEIGVSWAIFYILHYSEDTKRQTFKLCCIGYWLTKYNTIIEAIAFVSSWDMLEQF